MNTEITDLAPVTPGDIEVSRPPNPTIVYIASLGERSRRVVKSDLDTMARLITGEAETDAREVNWHELQYQHTAALRSRLAENFAPATVNRMLSSLRGVLKACWRWGMMTSEQREMASDLTPVRGESLPAGRGLTAGELHTLFTVCADGTPAGARDAALLAVMYAAGLRRSEAVTLDVTDYDSNSGALTVRHGKGNKARTGYTSNGSRVALEAWLLVRGSDPGALFLPIRRGGHLQHGRRLTDQAVLTILHKRSVQAEIKHCSPHDFRRSFISDLLDRGADIATVQKMAGHSNVSTTARYDRRGEEAKQKAAELLHVPYVASVTNN